jgi:hypothetical protein
VDGLGTERRPRIEQEHALRAAGGWREAAGAVEPAGGPAARPLQLRLAVGAGGCGLESGQEYLFERPLEGSHSQAFLELAVGAPLVEAVKGGEEAGGGGRAAAAAARNFDCRGDVVRLAERVAQGLDLGELVVAVVALGPSRLRVAQAALPGAKRRRADAEHFGSSAGADSAHTRVFVLLATFLKSEAPAWAPAFTGD